MSVFIIAAPEFPGNKKLQTIIRSKIVKLSQLFFCVPVLALSFGVQAAVITSTSHVDYPQESFTDSDSETSNTPSSSVSTEASIWGGEWGPYASSFGNSDGAFALRAGGYGYGYTADSSFRYDTSLTNTMNASQNAFLDLNFDAGRLEANFRDAATSSADLEMRAQVMLNNVVVWETGALMQANTSSPVHNVTYYGDFENYSSVDVSGLDGGGLSWGEHSYHIDLGLVDALTTYDLTYVISVYAKDYGTEGYSNTRAGMGDPFYLGQTPFDSSSLSFLPVGGSSVAVSEPSSLALLGLGALLLIRRRLS